MILVINGRHFEIGSDFRPTMRIHHKALVVILMLFVLNVNVFLAREYIFWI